MHLIEGIWLSHYEYGQGADNKPRVSDGVINFAQNGNKWVGLSLPNKEESVVSINLQQLKHQRQQFVGDWHVYTSPTGHYKGHKFNGLVVLLLSEDRQGLTGQWIGANNTAEVVKHGAWTLRRIASPFGRLQLLIDSHPDLKQAVDKDSSLLVEQKSGRNAYVDHFFAAGRCLAAFVEGYDTRTPEENDRILATADQLLLEFGTNDGIGYAIDMSFGESLALRIHNGEVPVSADDLAKYPNLHKSIMITLSHLAK